MSPLIIGNKKHVGWVNPSDEDPSDYDKAQFYCLSCMPSAARGAKTLYADDFPGDKFACDLCGTVIEFEQKK